jgi:ribonuclease Z
MNAKYVLLNHFSQRYPKMPSFNEDHVDFAGVAFDLMSINFSDFSVISKLYYILQELYQVVASEDENENGKMEIEKNKNVSQQQQQTKKKVGSQKQEQQNDSTNKKRKKC